MAGEMCEDKSREMVSSSAGFCYSEVSTGNPAIQTHLGNQIQGFESDPADMFNLTTSMDMIGFSKNLHHHQQSESIVWKSFPGKPTHPNPGPSSSSKTAMNNESGSTNFYQYTTKPDFTSNDNLIIGGAHHHHHDSSSTTWQDNRLLVDDSSLRCVFPCEGNERPSQGLSLSLSSNNPLSIGLQSFELRQTNNHPHHHHQNQPDFVSSTSGDKLLLGKSMNPQHQQQEDEAGGNLYQGHFLLKNSRYLVAAQELLNEFCSLGMKQGDMVKQKSSSHKSKQWEDDNGIGLCKKHPVGSLEFIELQKRKTKLLSMLEEVERRYRHYCNQMKAVVSSFEEVAGTGAARVYSALALKAMSRHFRCLKDGILSQIEVARRGMGEKDPVAPGTTKGETPRLRIIDQALRQQRAFQQMSMMESHPWRPQRGLPERSVSVLRAWLFEHFLHPYPSDMDKHILARQTGLSRSQVSNWFINARVRLWKPMVEEMYLEEMKEHENNMASSEGVSDPGVDDNNMLAVATSGRNLDNPPPTSRMPEDQKPLRNNHRLLRIDSECVSSIINNHPPADHHKNESSTKNNSDPQDQHCNNNTFGSVELDFSSYNTHHHHSAAGIVSYSNENNNSGGGVSLTLGLQQHGEAGVSLAFPPPSQLSLFYPRDQMEDCQPVQYSLLDGEAQNLPYRNLMGAQLLHDLAG
ncbi:homeobox protein BEL1 homolog [Prosopis cineraria]|uniref:homeobox protein BEL1 homolog n=1 Tax=Prosopis cineraria TaxID=364024 RepID=UPI00240FCD58|nr:homeobox protein BEL1 homolog [Prosopis cineraria]XP_054809243.1 homeobox protein BEL1 homolog [Prosopis cineraria]XP_054809244.1 homeobox protein BEL1 homolog [Prosopis cineraria]XP_054809245.1 homeobox protein BEL1 homolog [Prosopis cineraria]